jgi:hypothetical protein
MRHHPTYSGLSNENGLSDALFGAKGNFTPSHSRLEEGNFFVRSNQPNFGVERNLTRGPENMFAN